jgi:hypothetical protein
MQAEDRVLRLPARPPASVFRDLEPVLEPPAVLQTARVSLRLQGALVVDTCTIQLEECQLPTARVQEHRLAVLGVTQVKNYLLISPDTFNGDIKI